MSSFMDKVQAVENKFMDLEQQISDPSVIARQDEWQEQTQSVFASVEVGWKSMLYLTLTGRNDWASQLANSSTPCFFYPSVGLSGVISEMLTLPEFIDYMKVRGSFSSVGMPYPRNLTSPLTNTMRLISNGSPRHTILSRT